MPTNASEHLSGHEQPQGLDLATNGENGPGDVPSWQGKLMLLQLSEATVGVATNQETPSSAMILTWMDRTVWFSNDIL